MKAIDVQKKLNIEYCTCLQRGDGFEKLQPVYELLSKLRHDEGLDKLTLPNLEKHFKTN